MKAKSRKLSVPQVNQEGTDRVTRKDDESLSTSQTRTTHREKRFVVDTHVAKVQGQPPVFGSTRPRRPFPSWPRLQQGLPLHSPLAPLVATTAAASTDCFYPISFHPPRVVVAISICTVTGCARVLVRVGVVGAWVVRALVRRSVGPTLGHVSVRALRYPALCDGVIRTLDDVQARRRERRGIAAAVTGRRVRDA